MKKLTSAALAAAALAACVLPLTIHTARIRSVSAAKILQDDPCAVLSELHSTAAAPKGAYRLERILPVAYGKVYRFTRMEDGAEVFGGQVAVSVDDEGNVLSVSGGYSPLEVAPAAIEADEASRPYDALSVTPFVYEGEPAYEIVTATSRIMVSARDGHEFWSSPRAAGVLTAQQDAYGQDVVIDVKEEDGEYVLADEMRNIYVYDARNRYYPEGASRLIESEGKAFTDAVAVSVFQNLVRAYDFYTDADNIGVSLHGMGDFDDAVAGNMGQGNREFPIEVYLHYWREYENAAFAYDPSTNTGLMYVGDGTRSGILYQPGKAIDVIAHEYQHGVTQFTCDLVYENESGALNEAFSDMFAALIEGYAPSDSRFWRIGEDAVTESYDELRSMAGGTEDQSYTIGEEAPLCHRAGDHANHTSGGQSCDSGNVHSNSTIATHLQYVAYTKLPGYFTRERIGTLWYTTLCKLSENATFRQFAKQFLQSALDLHFDAEAVEAIRESLEECGFTDMGTKNGLQVVTFANYDGSPAAAFALWMGEKIPVPQIGAVRADDEKYTYTFRAWNIDPDTVTGDAVVTADYTSELRTFRVVFLDAEGNVWAERTAEYGGTVELPEGPEKAATDEYLYGFIGWDGDVTAVTEDLTLTPLYESEAVKYDVVYISDGKVYRTLLSAYGETPSLTKLSAPFFSFRKFEGWYTDEAHTMSADGASVTQGMTLYAAWGFDPLPVVVIVFLCVAAATASGLTVFFVMRRRRRR